MRVPEIEEVREYFKDAWEVEDMYGDTGVVLTDKIERDVDCQLLSYVQGDYMSHKLKIDHLVLWQEGQGYAKIISYKKKTYQITEEQIKKVEKGKLNMRELFPEVFKPVLEAGKWYRRKDKDIDWLMCYTGNNEGYGFNTSKEFATDYMMKENEAWKETSFEEAKEALIKEAEKKGFKEGVKFKGLGEEDKRVRTFGRGEYGPGRILWFDNLQTMHTTCGDTGKYVSSDPIIFQDGKWAEIVKEEPVELTLQEIADKFEIDVELLKIKK